MIKKALLAAAGAATLTIPSAAAAQGYYGQEYGRGDPAPRGDYDGARRGFPGYPEFRGIEEHIRREIEEGVREDLIEPDDARDLLGQLRDIRRQEAREFSVHRWNLPADDRYRIRTRLEELDRTVDQIRAEPEG